MTAVLLQCNVEAVEQTNKQEYIFYSEVISGQHIDDTIIEVFKTSIIYSAHGHYMNMNSHFVFKIVSFVVWAIADE